MPSWLKAGLIAGVVLIVVALIGQIPVLGCLSLPLTWVGYILAGVLAAIYMLPPRNAGAAAGQGALAGVIAQIMGGLVSLVLGVIQASNTDTAAILSQIPKESLDQLRQAGVDPSIFVGPAGTGGVLLVCCGVGVIIAAVLAAISAAITAAVRPS
jgi:hypothetical protein